MKIIWNELTVNFNRGDSDLLGDWRWLVGNTAQPIFVSALGDAFLEETDGSIWWLDVGAGKLHNVAQSGDEYNPENMEPTDLSVHFSIQGQIHQQVRDLPEGTRIGSIKIREPQQKG